MNFYSLSPVVENVLDNNHFLKNVFHWTHDLVFLDSSIDYEVRDNAVLHTMLYDVDALNKSNYNSSPDSTAYTRTCRRVVYQLIHLHPATPLRKTDAVAMPNYDLDVSRKPMRPFCNATSGVYYTHAKEN